MSLATSTCQCKRKTKYQSGVSDYRDSTGGLSFRLIATVATVNHSCILDFLPTFEDGILYIPDIEPRLATRSISPRLPSVVYLTRLVRVVCRLLSSLSPSLVDTFMVTKNKTINIGQAIYDHVNGGVRIR